MELGDLPAETVEKLFELGCFLIVNNLPIGSQFSIDGSSSITGPLFQGIKLIPPGFHVISIVPAKSGTTRMDDDEDELPSSSSQIGHLIKTGFLRFFKEKEVVVRNYDPETESLRSIDDDHQDTMISIDYMKTLDPKLAPYPLSSYIRWKSLTNLIKPVLVQKVFVSDKFGDFTLDSTMGNQSNVFSSAPPPGSVSGSKLLRNRMIWGKPRPETEESKTGVKTDADLKQHFTNWPFVDLKRSWPKDCVGPELTRWSRDKSWLLNQIIINQLDNDTNQILGLIQLSFLTFVQVHSIQSFESYQLYINLITKSEPGQLIKFSSKYINLLSNLVGVLRDQYDFLDQDFFQRMEDFQIENWFFDCLNLFRRILNQISREDEGGDMRKCLKDHRVGSDWQALQKVCRKFDWNVRPLKIEERDQSDSEEEVELTSSDIDDEDDNKPVVVEL
ncbi:A1 cistron-splicing factor [Phakopsora pachyrhizi]|nr:A1 cistron-splicing factor [Phakopsora pachyrhizi]